MVSLGQKLKMPKTWEKPFYKKIRVVLWEKRAKNTQDSRNEKILKIGHLAKVVAHARAIAFAKWSVYRLVLVNALHNVDLSAFIDTSLVTEGTTDVK